MTYKLQSGKRASHLATAVHAILAKVANDGQLAVVRARNDLRAIREALYAYLDF
jgi:hypothetical protein